VTTLIQLVDAELTPIKLLLDTVPPSLREWAAAARRNGDEMAATVYLQALGCGSVASGAGH
jgi:hypothetical protein